MSWKSVALGDVCNFQNGFAFKSNLFEEDGLPILRISNIQNQTIDTNNLVYFKLHSYKEKLEKYIVEPQDLLIAMSGATTGKIGFNNTNQRFYLNQRVGNLKPKQDLNKKYLYYFLSTQVENNLSISAGAAQPNLSTEQIKEMLIPLPPLVTQQKIVSKLDAIFAEIDKSTAAAEANAKNAEALWQSMIDKVITDFLHLNNEVLFSEVAEIQAKLVDPKEKKFQDLLHIGAGNMVSNNGELCELKSAKEENLISGKFIFDENTVLYSKIRPYLKKVAQPSFVGLCSADVYPLVCKRNRITKDFLFYILLSTDFTNYAIDGSDRAGMPKVNREHLFSYQFNLPSLEQQSSLTKKIKNSYESIKIMDRVMKRKIVVLSLLKQTILKQAFNGELVKE